MNTGTTTTEPATRTYVPIPRRLDFDALAPVFSRAVSALDDGATAELDRAGIDAQLREFVRLRASQLNGCAYCVDVHTAAAREAGATDQRVHAVAIWEDSPFFTARERAALALTESVTRLSETHVPSSVVTGALAEFSEEETAALIALVIAINTWNAIGVTTRCWSPQPKGD
ncbi:carboxymuconolactone decarboxylase family protein [Streptomyces sp. NPDC049881]|uniref:carboxymuconolactone decarboxylase family protein n=1 Tax=Streptomyces sp. NPDC049881 TaxID=3155778 RepID=UPI003412DF6E